MPSPTWAHASLAVVVPVTPRPDRQDRDTSGSWDLQGLFPHKHVIATPNEVAWEPIRDARTANALHPTRTERYLPAGSTSDRTGDLDALLSKIGWTETTLTTPPAHPDDDTDEPEDPAARESAEEPAVSDAARTVHLPPGVSVRAIEVLHYNDFNPDTGPNPGPDTDEPAGGRSGSWFLVLHLLLTGDALVDPGQVAAFFGRTAQRVDQRTGYPNKTEQQRRATRRLMTTNQWRVLCRALGFAPIGPDKDLHIWRPFVISHLVPHANQGIPPAPFAPAASLDGWDLTSLWAWRMTGGQWLNQTWEPPRGLNDAVRDGSWLGSTWSRSSASAMTCTGTRGVTERGTVHPREGATWWRDAESFENVEHVRVAAMTHRHAVWLAALVMRQGERLQQHSVALTNDLVWPAEAHQSTEGVLSDEYVAQARTAGQQALVLEYRLLRIRSQLWFTQLPGLEAESQLLQQMQGVRGLPALLEDVEAEQQQVTRVLDQQAARVLRDDRLRAERAAQEARDEADRVAQEARDEAERVAQEARDEAERVAQEARKAQEDKIKSEDEREKRVSRRVGALTTFLGLFFILDTALAITQVWQEGGWDDVTTTATFALPVVLLVALLIGVVVLHANRDEDEEKGKKKGQADKGSDSGLVQRSAAK